MKELDKAIINGDIDRIVFLIKDNNIDCKGAVLMHLKEKLIPKHFSEEELQKKEGILNIEVLKAIIQDYLAKSTYDPLSETYIKRLYFSLQQALKTWQEGAMANEKVAQEWNKQAVDYLTTGWVKDELPDNIKDYAATKQKKCITDQYQKWQNQSLEKNELELLDNIIHKSLISYYWTKNADSKDAIIEQIKMNILDQTVEFYRKNPKDISVNNIQTFINKKIFAQIQDGSINEELIRSAIEQEKDALLQGKLVLNQLKYYEEGVKKVFERWQKGDLLANTMDDVTNYIKKQLKEYKLPGKLMSSLVEKAIQQLLDQYKNEQLDPEILEHLAKQIEGNIIGYYEGLMLKETPFRQDLAKTIFSDLLNDWKNSGLSADVNQYLQKNLLADVQKIIWDLSFYTSRSAMASQIKQLQEMVIKLGKEVAELKKDKRQENGKEWKDINENKTDSMTASKLGMFSRSEKQKQNEKDSASKSVLENEAKGGKDFNANSTTEVSKLVMINQPVEQNQDQPVRDNNTQPSSAVEETSQTESVFSCSL